MKTNEAVLLFVKLWGFGFAQLKNGWKAFSASDRSEQKVREAIDRRLKSTGVFANYRLGETYGLRWIVCLKCGMKSFNHRDVEGKYCGRCHKFRDR